MEWRARRLADPIERLQFLRRQAAPGSVRSKSKWKQSRLTAAAFLLVLVTGGAVLVRSRANPPVTASPKPRSVVREAATPAPSPAHVWLVDSGAGFDLYSNGLRVESQFSTSTSPRSYLAFSRARPSLQETERRSDPAGIVFHTTESHMAPFEEKQNRALRRDGEGTLEYVSRRRSYHFVIDRFGRVFRIVRETDYANHAGNSIWADEERIYVNLNQSFFGIAFEAQSSAAELPANSAQIHAARTLVEMLRARYKIPSGNCVAHAQVSVNPVNGRAGYHTDWAANLPFEQLGLSNNYLRPPPSLTLFGFVADAALLSAGSAGVAQGIEIANQELEAGAAARNVPIARYRRDLQERYRQAVAAERHTTP